MNLTNAKITVTGATGFLGWHVLAELAHRGVPQDNIFTPTRARGSDLLRIQSCLAAVRHQDLVIHLAADVGGIGKNKRQPFTLWSHNLRMGLNLLDAARQTKEETGKAPKVVIAGTICEYPKFTPVPFREEHLWDGYPEETNAPYGIAKKALLVGGQALRQEFGITVVHLLPVNLYGPRDHFDLANSHVIPALIRKVHEAKTSGATTIKAWGTGKATREFLYVEDAAQAIVSAAERYDGTEPINIGCGQDRSIKELLETICNLMDWHGTIEWDHDQPDGQPQRRLDVRRATELFGWTATTPFEQGLRRTIGWYLQHACTPTT